MTNEQTPPPGWYPAPHANGEQRYWDGTGWQEPPAASVAVVAPTDPAAKPKRKGLRWWAWVLIAIGALILISAIGAAIGGGGDDSKPATSQSAPAEEETPVAPVMVTIPDLAGRTADEAASELKNLKLTPETTTAGDAAVTGTDPAAGTAVEEGSTVKIIATEKPQLTVSQQNAARKAESYISLTGFSRQGLIDQLVFEGFPAEDAAVGVDSLAIDFNEQAARKAQSYIDLSGFSRQGLIDQLVFEGFSQEQAEFGATAVGL